MCTGAVLTLETGPDLVSVGAGVAVALMTMGAAVGGGGVGVVTLPSANVGSASLSNRN